MGTSWIPITNFTSGEVSPRLRARIDLDRYLNGCDTLQNFVTLPHGPVTRRPGTAFVAAAKSNSADGALLGFEFSDEQALMLEFGAASVRFYQDQAQVAVANVASAVTNGLFGANIVGWTDSSSGGGASIAWDATNHRLSLIGAAGQTSEARQPITIAAGDQATEHVLTFQIFGVAGDLVRVLFGTAAGGGQLVDQYCGPGWHAIAVTPGAATLHLTFKHTTAKTLGVDTVVLLDNQALEIGSPYAAADVGDLVATQINDVQYLFHPDYPTYTLSRLASASWSLEEVDWIDGPYLPENVSAITLTAAAGTGLGVNLTASAALWAATDVGRAVRITDGTTTGWARIVSFTSTTVVKADIRAAVPTTACLGWRLGAWSARTGYPACATLDQQRVIAGGAAWDPGRVEGSVTGDFETFTPGADDDAALSAPVPERRVNAIRWIVSDTVTLIGTAGCIARLGNPDGETPLSPTSMPLKRQPKFGAAAVQPVEVGNALLYVQRRGRKIRELSFDFASNAWVANRNILELAEHLTKAGTITRLFYQQEPWSIVWAIRSDGQLLGCTYVRNSADATMYAWHVHPLGGTDVVVISGDVIPGAAGDDEVWLLVSRTVNGSEKRTVELLQPFFDESTAVADAWFVDCGLKYDGAATDAVTGLGHLEGETVQVLVDGASHPDCVVTGGEIILDRDGSVIIVGLEATPILTPVQIEGGAADGASQGRLGKVDELVVRFDNTVGCLIGRDLDHLEELPFRTSADAMSTALPPYTGDIQANPEMDMARARQFTVSHNVPLPITIVGVFAKVSVAEG